MSRVHIRDCVCLLSATSSNLGAAGVSVSELAMMRIEMLAGDLLLFCISLT